MIVISNYATNRVLDFVLKKMFLSSRKLDTGFIIRDPDSIRDLFRIDFENKIFESSKSESG